ncbi:HAMP domain-containing histidine kinase [Lachnospiraceae bacterium NSJ-143]|nr:HAMP domain-containing histidine kinase [Lachnospiraceae bacterium NSJ-143]
MFKHTILKKQMFLYMSIILILFGIFGSGISFIYTRHYMNEQEQQLILQGERFKESLSNLYYSGDIDASSLNFEFQVMKKYMGTSVFFMNSKGQISFTSSDVNQKWIGQTITDEAVNIVLNGKVATVQGKIGGMFNEAVLTVGYPIVIDGTLIGGVFMCKPMDILRSSMSSVVFLMLGYMVPVIIMGLALIYYSTKKITGPLIEMNEAAKVIADGRLDKRIEVESEDEVGQLATSFNLMAESLEETEKCRREFIANVSHDLRSPLTSIRGFIEAIADGTIPYEKQNYYLKIVMEETGRLSKLANDMVDLSSVQAGAMVLERCDFDINDLIRESVEAMEPRFNKKNIKVNAIFTDEVTIVNADPNKIKRVIQNLLDNAVKFSYDGGEITAEVQEKDKKVFVYIRDNGKGITDDEMKHVFERFFKADASRGLDKTGVGLGLSIVKEFINAHGERVDVKSRPEGGTEFLFTLKPADKK